MLWACDEKRVTLRRKEAMIMKVQGRRKRGRPTRRWFDKVKNYIKEKGLSAVVECVRAWDTLPLFEATVCGRS